MIYNQADMSTMNNSSKYSAENFHIWAIIKDLCLLLIISAVCGAIVYAIHPIKERSELKYGVRWIDISSAKAENPLWVDAREPENFAKGHIPSSVNMPLRDWESSMMAFAHVWDHKQAVVVYCDGGGCNLSTEVAERLKKSVPEADIQVLEGGYPAWLQNASSKK